MCRASVEIEHTLIVAQQVTTEATDNRCLLLMAEAAQTAVSSPEAVLHVVAHAGYSSGEQPEAANPEAPFRTMPATRGVNNQGDGKLFDRTVSVYQPEQDSFLCPPGQLLKRDQISRKDRSVYYTSRLEVCGACQCEAGEVLRVDQQRIIEKCMFSDQIDRHGRQQGLLIISRCGLMALSEGEGCFASKITDPPSHMLGPNGPECAVQPYTSSIRPAAIV